MRQSNYLRNPTSKQLRTIAGATLPLFFFLKPPRSPGSVQVIKSGSHIRVIISRLFCQSAFICVTRLVFFTKC